MPMGGVWGGIHNEVHSLHPSQGPFGGYLRKWPFIAACISWMWKDMPPPMSTLFRQVENLIDKVASKCCQNVAFARLTLKDIQIIGIFENILQHIWIKMLNGEINICLGTNMVLIHPQLDDTLKGLQVVLQILYFLSMMTCIPWATYYTPWGSSSSSLLLMNSMDQPQQSKEVGCGGTYKFQSSMLIFHYKMLGYIMYQTLFLKLAWI